MSTFERSRTLTCAGLKTQVFETGSGPSRLRRLARAPSATADRFGGEVHHLGDVSHWAMLEARERVAPLIRSFASK